MKTFWKVSITIGVLALFLLGVIGIIVVLSEGMGGGSSFFAKEVRVIPVKGLITSSGCGGSLFSGPMSCAQVPLIKEQLKAAETDPSVGAIVLDIESGGGSVVASRELMREVKGMEKPVVSWIGEAGASGAYYVASASDYIVADRNSITGSIGVISTMFHYYDLMDEVGVNVTVIKSGETKDIGSPFRPMTDDEQGEFEDIVDKIYLDFVEDVAENRGLDFNYTENVSRGKIYLGRDAVDIGLIDETGSRDDAINKAAELAGIEGEPVVDEYERELTFWDVFL